jgi:hypothetical protein
MAYGNWQEWITVTGYLTFLVGVTVLVLWPRDNP